MKYYSLVSVPGKLHVNTGLPCAYGALEITGGTILAYIDSGIHIAHNMTANYDKR
jgi:hypothetical protein